MNTPTDSIEFWNMKVRVLADGWHDEDFRDMAIEERNEILDEIARIEEKSEALAEERRRGDWAIPSHVRGLL